MAKLSLSLCLCLIFITTSSCSDDSKEEIHPSIHEYYSPELLTEDFDQLLRVLKKNHPALYDFTNQTEFDKIVSEQRNRIRDSLTVTEFYDLLAPIVHSVGCGHTVLNLPGWIWTDSTINLQHDISYFNDSTWLRSGGEVISINEIPVTDILSHTTNYTSTDGKNLSASRQHMNRNFSLYAASYLGFPENYEVVVRHKTDSVRHISLSTINIKRYDDLLNDTSPLLTIGIDSVENLAVITIKSFGFYNDVDKFNSFIDESFEKIERYRCKSLILDLRGNSGGDPLCASHLFKYLIHEPTAYFSTSYPQYEKLASKLAPARRPFAGKIFTLIDGACFSTTGHLCALLRYNNIGKFIGTETGGTYTCNDGSQTYKLINSGILIRVPGTTFEVAVAGLERFKGIDPDYVVETSLKDFLDEKDSVMEYAKLQVRMQL